uniref:RAD51 associated protein 1 n=1 Tax=Salarias fasciatus TaxID=181472 RepID=A0A672HFZ7_SALFA
CKLFLNYSFKHLKKPLDEKLLERDLEAAITLSMLNDTVELPSGENADPSSLLRSNCSVDSEVLGLDKITSENPKKGQKKTEEPKKKDEDDDYEPKLTPDSESDEDFSEPDESDEEEFTVKKTSKTKKKEKISKSEKPKTSPAANKAKRPSKPSKSKSAGASPSTPVRSPPSAKPAPRRSVSSSAVPTSKPSVSVSPAGGRVPKWNPPAQIGKSPTSCQRPAGPSPGQGLRLGLSRLVRVKPLHPSVASH